MTWDFRGTADDLNLECRRSEFLLARGGGAHELSPGLLLPRREVDEVNRRLCVWGMVSCADRYWDYGGSELVERIEQDAGKVHCSMSVSEHSGDIEVAIVMPERRHQAAMELLRTVLLNHRNGYKVSVDFPAFVRYEGATAISVFDAVLSGTRFVFTADVSVSVGKSSCRA